jgi:hypothetical protein
MEGTIGSQRQGWEYNIKVGIKESGVCEVNFCYWELGPYEHRSERLSFPKGRRFITT